MQAWHPAIDLAVTIASGAVIIKQGGRWAIRKAGQEAFEEISEREALKYLDEGVDVLKRSADEIAEQGGNVTRGRYRGQRWKSSDDALQQLEEIEESQRLVRKGKLKKHIDSVQKSRDRLQHRLDRVRDRKDLGDF